MFVDALDAEHYVEHHDHNQCPLGTSVLEVCIANVNVSAKIYVSSWSTVVPASMGAILLHQSNLSVIFVFSGFNV
jgi:hypothetical protein